MSQRTSPSSPDRQIILLANREPYRHERDAGNQLHVARSASGVVNAVEPLLLANSGVWIAEGVGIADRQAASDRDGLDVPVGNPRYRLRRVFLSPAEQRGYYFGFANSALWPLCHRTAVEPVFYAKDFYIYERVNRRFADAVAEESVGSSPIVLVQDYHFALAPLFIRRQLPRSRIATFWHVPWPRPSTLGMCPWSQTLLEGLLGSTSIGFQTPADQYHFLAAVERLPGAHVDRAASTVNYKDRQVSVGVFPASIRWADPSVEASGSVHECRQTVLQELGLQDGVRLGVGVDRFDYTKGLEHKFMAIERLLERRPDLLGSLVFVQLAEPSREGLSAYRSTRIRIRAAAARINERFAHATTRPLRLLEDHHSATTVSRFLRAADFCYVGSLHDGMNLVSKEFVRARDDERGVLILSRFAGAASQLTDALTVNPYDIDGAVNAVLAALTMTPQEQGDRMRRMRDTVSRASASEWATGILNDVTARHERGPQAKWRTSLSKNHSGPVSLPHRAVSGVSVS